MSTLLAGLLEDLAAESEDLDRLVADLDADGWSTPTPATPWSVADTIAHLLWTDRIAALAATDEEAFAAELAGLAEQAGGGAAEDAVTAVAQRLASSHDPAGLLAAWREGRSALVRALTAVPEGGRLPWFGTSMAPASMATARLMETWAHGHDVAHALGVSRAPTDRLRHVVRLAVRARPYAHTVNGLDAPVTPVRVELTGPDGDTWREGPEEATDVVTGSAYDFCLVAVQRMHPDDTDLEAHGEAAAAFLDVVQAFAGPPGPGRSPGEGHR